MTLWFVRPRTAIFCTWTSLLMNNQKGFIHESIWTVRRRAALFVYLDKLAYEKLKRLAHGSIICKRKVCLFVYRDKLAYEQPKRLAHESMNCTWKTCPFRVPRQAFLWKTENVGSWVLLLYVAGLPFSCAWPSLPTKDWKGCLRYQGWPMGVPGCGRHLWQEAGKRLGEMVARIFRLLPPSVCLTVRNQFLALEPKLFKSFFETLLKRTAVCFILTTVQHFTHRKGLVTGNKLEVKQKAKLHSWWFA
jgi:hypothetical protein